MHHRRNINTEEKAKVCRCCCLGDRIDYIPAVLTILHQDDLKKRINRIKATWQNGCFEKMDDHPVDTIQTTTLPKWVSSQKLLFKSSLLING